MALATSNLKVSDILTELGALNARGIFYSGQGYETLKSIEYFGQMVNKYGINENYCPGTTPDERLQNLLTYRLLSYFKGYENFILTLAPTGMTASANGASYGIIITANQSWTLSENISWITPDNTQGTGSTTIHVFVGPNNTGSVRNGVLTFTGTESGMIKTFNIAQPST